MTQLIGVLGLDSGIKRMTEDQMEPVELLTEVLR